MDILKAVEEKHDFITVDENFKYTLISINGQTHTLIQNNVDGMMNKSPFLTLVYGENINPSNYFNDVVFSTDIWKPIQWDLIDPSKTDSIQLLKILETNAINTSPNERRTFKECSYDQETLFAFAKSFFPLEHQESFFNTFLDEINHHTTLFKNAVSFFVSSYEKLGADVFEDLKNPFHLIKHNDTQYIRFNNDPISFILKLCDNNEIKGFFVENDKYYKYDDMDNPLHTQSFLMSEIEDDFTSFEHYFKTTKPSFMIDSSNTLIGCALSFDDVFYYLDTLNAHIHDEFFHIFKNNAQMISTYDELKSFELGYNSISSKVQSIFLNSSDYCWINGSIVNKKAYQPYKAKDLVDKPDKLSKLYLMNQYKNSLLLSIPDNVHNSFKPLFKQILTAFENKNVRTDFDEDIIKLFKKSLKKHI